MQKQPGYSELPALGAAVSFIYLAWKSATEPVIRLHKAHNIEANLSDELAEFLLATSALKEAYQKILITLSRSLALMKTWILVMMHYFMCINMQRMRASK